MYKILKLSKLKPDELKEQILKETKKEMKSGLKSTTRREFYKKFIPKIFINITSKKEDDLNLVIKSFFYITSEIKNIIIF